MNAKDTLSLERFPIVVDSGCKTIDRIYPTKQKQIAEIYEFALKTPEIKKITVFGSSVTPKCRWSSDLDLCIDESTGDGNIIFDIQKAIGDICEWNCDIIMDVNVGSSLRSVLNKEGVVIYE